MNTLEEFAESMERIATMLQYDAKEAHDETIPEGERWKMLADRYLNAMGSCFVMYRAILDLQEKSRKELVEA